MDAAQYAYADCSHCGGQGMVLLPSEDGRRDWRLCPCTLLAQRRAAIGLVTQRVFPGALAEMTIASYDPGESELNQLGLTAAKNFIDDWDVYRRDGGIVGFWGKPASGKTHLAVGIARALLDRFMVRPTIVSVPSLMRAERETFRTGGESPIDAAARAEMLILDDLGAEYLVDRSGGRSDVSWVDEQLYLILDERVANARPIVYTTNLAPGDLMAALSGRVASRIERAEVGVFEIERVAGMGRVGEERRASLIRPREERRP